MRELIDRHKDRLFAFVLRTVRHHHDAEEVCQEAFLKAFRSIDSFDSQYRFSTWLFTIAYRLCLNLIRRRKDLTGDVDFTTLSTTAAPVDADSAQSEEARRLKAVVWEAVDRLSTAQRATVMLFYRQQMGCAEIAEVLGFPVATVKSHLHRARARLKEILEPVVAEDFSRLRILTELAG
jgi:RNA polymerase sigma-70 factor (ECF subfamily)